MVSIGVGSILSGQGMARVKGATRDVYAAIRHARSVALVTGQRVLVNYSNEPVDDETCVKIEVVAAKIMSVDGERPKPTPYWVEDYKDLPQKATAQGGGKRELVHIRKPGEGDNANSGSSEGGETLEEILFSPMDSSVIKGMRILVKKGDEALTEETDVQRRSRISVYSNVGYLKSNNAESDNIKSGYKEAKGQKLVNIRGSNAKGFVSDGESGDASGVGGSASSSGSVNDMDEEVSVVW